MNELIYIERQHMVSINSIFRSHAGLTFTFYLIFGWQSGIMSTLNLFLAVGWSPVYEKLDMETQYLSSNNYVNYETY